MKDGKAFGACLHLVGPICAYLAECAALTLAVASLALGGAHAQPNFFPGRGLAVASTNAPPRFLNADYEFTLSADGGVPPYSWPVSTTGLPVPDIGADELTDDNGHTPTRSFTTASGTPTETPTPSVTDGPSASRTPTVTATASGTPTVTNTPPATRTPTDTAPSTATLTVAVTVNPTFAACAGNCDASTVVTIDELVRAVNIGLGKARLQDCERADVNGDGRVSVDELVQAVGNSLYGCGVTPPTPLPTGTPTRIPTATATRPPTVTPSPTRTGTPRATDTPLAPDTSCVVRDLGNGRTESVSGSTRNKQNSFSGRCGGGGATDQAYLYRAPVDGFYTFYTDDTSFDTVVYVLDADCNGVELGCNDDAGANPGNSQLTLLLRRGQQVVTIVDGFKDENGDFRLHIREGEPPPTPTPSVGSSCNCSCRCSYCSATVQATCSPRCFGGCTSLCQDTCRTNPGCGFFVSGSGSCW